MRTKSILVATLVSVAVLAATVPAHAGGGFYIGFGWGRPYSLGFGAYYYGGHYPGYRPYQPHAVWVPPYRYYYRTPAAAYYPAPYVRRAYRVYERRPRVYVERRYYSEYTPRVYRRR